MTPEEILENNRLIAEFMGAEIKEKKTCILPVVYFKDPPVINDTRYTGFEMNYLKYHSSWDWLMPVVEKIEELGSFEIMNRKLYNSVEFTRSNVTIYFSPNQKFLLHLELKAGKVDDPWKHMLYKHHIIKQFDFRKKGRFMGLYSAIIEFIKWYNQNQKS